HAWGRDALGAVGQPEVEVVERGGADGDRHGAGLSVGLGPVANAHALRSDRLLEHGGAPLAQRRHLRNLTKSPAVRSGRGPTLSNLGTKAMRVAVFVLTLGSFLLSALPAASHSALPPGHQQIKYSRWAYPTQVAYGPTQAGP